MTAYEGMNRTELEATLMQLQDQLEEVLDERSLIIGQQNGHVSSKYISKQAVRFAKEIEELNGSIDIVKKLLGAS
jgi:hypothetical protein